MVDFRIVSVSAIKGGVGKSTVAVNLALTLRDQGVNVGLLDADVDSPYLPEIAGIHGDEEKVGLTEDRRMIPVTWNDIPVISFALWLPDQFAGSSMSGEMHERWLRDVLQETSWGDIDVLVVDLPAGNSDEYITIRDVAGDDYIGLIGVAQPNVTTALQRLYNTAKHNHLRILGCIENMSGEVFGTGDVKDFCTTHDLPYFGTIPLDQRIRERHEEGNPRLPKDVRGPIQEAAKAVQRELPVEVT